MNPLLKTIFRKYGVTAAYLFGSQARGKTHSKSDVDIAVRYKKTPELSTVLRFSNELSMYFKKPADVVDLRTAGLPLQFRVYQARTLLYASDLKAEVILRARAMSLYHDYRYYFDRFTKFEINRLATQGL